MNRKKRRAFLELEESEPKKFKNKVELEPHYLLNYDRIDILGDGNCVFRAIQYFLTKSQDGHEKLRMEVTDFMLENSSEYEELFLKRGKIKTFDAYIKNLKKPDVWGDHLELVAASKLKQFNFQIHQPDVLSPLEHINQGVNRMLNLEFINQNHYNVLELKQSSKILINLQRMKREEVPSKQDDESKPTKLKVQKRKAQAQPVEKLENDNENLTTQSQEVPKKKKEWEGCYPLAKMGFDSYNEVFKYLKYCQIPNRFNGKNSTSITNWKKYTEKNYRLVNKCMNGFSKSRLQVIKTNRVFKTIPFNEEIDKIIQEAHNGFEKSTIKHNGIRMTLRNITGPRMLIYWANMTHDVTRYIENCNQCAQEQPAKKIKVFKPIIPNGPFDRFTADLCEIDEDMRKDSGTQYRYVLSCVDHFSKYRWTEFVENKEASTVAVKLEYFFNFFQPPKHFQTDNGREFENQIIHDLCNRKSIKFIHGSPYYPQSQGVVEKLNDLLKKSLSSSHLAFKKNGDTKKKWDIESELKAWTANSNNNVHSVTKQVPNLAIHMKDLDEIQKVKKNIKDYYNNKIKANTKGLNLEIGSKVCIINEVRRVKTKNKLIKNKQSNLKTRGKSKKTKIPVEVVDVSNIQALHVKIKVCGKSIIENGIICGQIYSISINDLGFISDRSWKALI